ncbi:MAG: glycosyl hydrolase 53 family protein [Anaerolineales bacterium]|nr:glycosyl hydrolase 53 family protein [Anaerolineales bacterium]
MLIFVGCQAETAVPTPTSTLTPTATVLSTATPQPTVTPPPTATPLSFMRGVDVSFLPMIEQCNGRFTQNHEAVDALAFMAAQGVNFVRLRLWVNPADGANGLEDVLALAQRAHDLDLGLLLDFHFSDTWADPEHQTKPTAWADLPFADLQTAVTNHTRTTLVALHDQGTAPDVIQLGNEITNGFLWPDGRIGPGYEDNWQQFADLLKAAHVGVAQSFPGADRIPIMIHSHTGGDWETSSWFFDNLLAQNVPFDQIGLSFYPWWHGSLLDLQTNLDGLAARFGKPIVVVETAYPWTLDWADDVHNPVGEAGQLLPGYPASEQGQLTFLWDVRTAVTQLPHNLGAGFFYWAPDAITAPDCGSVWENVALFDFAGEALPGWQAFAP